MEKYKPSIISYSNYRDCLMIVDELIEQVTNLEEPNQQMIELLLDKKKEIESRYNR